MNPFFLFAKKSIFDRDFQSFCTKCYRLRKYDTKLDCKRSYSKRCGISSIVVSADNQIEPFGKAVPSFATIMKLITRLPPLRTWVS